MTDITPGPWPIQWYTCTADSVDVEWAAAKGETLVEGAVMWRKPISIGPVGPDHCHWAGPHLSCSETEARAIAETPALLDLLRRVAIDPITFADNPVAILNSWRHDARAILHRIEGAQS